MVQTHAYYSFERNILTAPRRLGNGTWRCFLSPIKRLDSLKGQVFAGFCTMNSRCGPDSSIIQVIAED